MAPLIMTKLQVPGKATSKPAGAWLASYPHFRRTNIFASAEAFHAKLNAPALRR